VKREEEELHAYDRPLLEDDRRWEVHNMGTPVLVIDMMRAAELWAILHPKAGQEERRMIVSLIAGAVGAECDICLPRPSR